MKLWIVYSDYGLNGCEVHGVYSNEPNETDIRKWAETEFVTIEGFHVRISGITGYGGTFIKEMDVDAPLEL